MLFVHSVQSHETCAHGETVRKLLLLLASHQKPNSHFWGFSKSNQCRLAKSSFHFVLHTSARLAAGLGLCTANLARSTSIIHDELTSVTPWSPGRCGVCTAALSHRFAVVSVAIAVNLFNLNIHNSNSSSIRFDCINLMKAKFS